MTTADELPWWKTVVAFKFLLDPTRLNYVDTVAVTSEGLELPVVKILTIFPFIDLSDNDFQGSIPPAVGELKALRVLNMSHNRLTGPIPPSISDLTMLESLDLSKNRLSGEIPPGLVRLSFLSTLYLRYNRLVGRIPLGGMFATFPRASFEGNEGLCGPPLPWLCSDATARRAGPTGPAPAPSFFYIWKFVFIGAGYGVGLGVAIVIIANRWKSMENWVLTRFPSVFRLLVH
ncbi:unnamed protein product [Spirodela intermedia]|uniref:Uncharacterized protein n=1 Tax=Spirodela intermedia TaxID=51605 RepID=A0A7I8IAY0_SPIIN|nr:unnamed protein product [Spirodela intermedia]CAA6654728.1 unnamed protein product [Spirodela intermedia]